MAKKKSSDVLGEIKKLVEDKKAVIGTKRTLKNLKLGKLSKVYMTVNCPEKVKQDIEYYAKFAKVPVVRIGHSNDELGILCKKSYSISVVSQVR